MPLDTNIKAFWFGQNWLINVQEGHHLAYALDITNDENSRLAAFIPMASKSIESYCKRSFMPFAETRFFDHPERIRSLALDEDLLSVDTNGFKTSNGKETFAASEFYLWPLNETPKHRIEILRDQGQVMQYSGTPQRSNQVAGLWGWHENTWRIDTVDTAGINATVTTLPVTNNVEDFSAGMHIRVGTEQMFVRKVAVSAKTVLVERGINGTVAAIHVSTDAIDVYSPPEELKFCAGILTARYEKRRMTAGGDLAGNSESGFRIVGQMPKDVKEILDKYRRVDVRGVGGEAPEWFYDEWYTQR